MQAPLPDMPYFVFLSRSEKRPLTEIWPIAFSEPLPVVPVPLLAGDADVPLDLQKTFTASYDLLGYDLAIDYSQPPAMPLRGEAATWLDERLRAARLRHNG